MSKAARDLRKSLDAELAQAAESVGESLEFSAVEEAVIAQILAETDRKVELQGFYDNAEDVASKVKLSAEIRLLEGSIARQLKQVRTDLPPAESLTTVKARDAAMARWQRKDA